MPTGESRRNKHSIQFFCSEDRSSWIGFVERLEAAGYDVQGVSTSGPTAIWVDDYEVIGLQHINSIVSQLVDEASHQERR